MIKNSDKTFIIGEISANHNGKIENAIQLVKECKRIGANAVKLQTYTPDTITIDSDKDCFKINSGTIWDGKVLYDLYKEAFMPWEWQATLMKIAKEEGIICFSSPFDKTSVDFLEKLNVSAYKIASFEITDIPLIKYVASKKKPIIISTGIATLEEIEEAINVCRYQGNNNITLLKCTSSYPAKYENMNLNTMVDMKSRFRCDVGLSDHTLGIEVPIAAVALGAKVIEKHITLSREKEGPDSKFSLEPNEFEEMIKSIRNVEKALGKVDYELSKSKVSERIFARSLFVVEDVKKGDIFNEKNLRSIRPANGLSPKYYEDIIGKKATMDIERGTPLSWGFIE